MLQHQRKSQHFHKKSQIIITKHMESQDVKKEEVMYSITPYTKQQNPRLRALPSFRASL